MQRPLAIVLLVTLAALPAWSQGEIESRFGLAVARDKADQPLIVDILDPQRVTDRRLDPSRPPILFHGRQPKDLMQLRGWLRGLANPDLFPDPTQPVIGPDGLRPSNKRLRLRCHQATMMGWIQAALQIVTIIPGETPKEAAARSPFIHRISFELMGSSRAFPFPLPTDVGVRRGHAPPRVIVRLRVSAKTKKAAPVQVSLSGIRGHRATLGLVNDVVPHSARSGRYSLKLQPDDLLMQLGQRLRRVRAEHPRAGVSLHCWPQVPFASAFEVLETCREAGFESIAMSGIASDLIKRLTQSPAGDTLPREEVMDHEEVEEIEEVEEEVEEVEPEEEITEEPIRTLRDKSKGLAVDKGLAWLAKHQEKDGHWSAAAHGGQKTHDVGVTGLAVLAFLGSGNTHRAGPYKDVVRRALRWLKSTQDAEGAFGLRGDHSFVYGHAAATLAMCEAYGMSRSGIWKTTAQNGVNFILKSQNPYKAWRYGVRPGDNDTSVTAWMLMALKSAKMGGLEISAHAEKWGLDFIEEMTDEATGRTGYTKRGELPVRAAGRLKDHPAANSEALTAGALVCRIFNKQDPRRSEIIQKGAELLMKKLPRWEPGHVDMVYWYWGTLASFQIGGKEWSAWNGALRKALHEHQVSEGDAKGSWPPAGPWGFAGGRVYSTALMTMCMEVYYRYARVHGVRR